MENKFELIPNQSEVSKPLFATDAQYEEFRMDFYDKIKDALRIQDKARAESARNMSELLRKAFGPRLR